MYAYEPALEAAASALFLIWPRPASACISLWHSDLFIVSSLSYVHIITLLSR